MENINPAADINGESEAEMSLPRADSIPHSITGDPVSLDAHRAERGEGEGGLPRKLQTNRYVAALAARDVLLNCERGGRRREEDEGKVLFGSGVSLCLIWICLSRKSHGVVSSIIALQRIEPCCLMERQCCYLKGMRFLIR